MQICVKFPVQDLQFVADLENTAKDHSKLHLEAETEIIAQLCSFSVAV